MACFSGLIERNTRSGERLFSFLFLGARAVDVYLLRPLGGFSEDDHAIGQDFGEAADERDVFDAGAGAIAEFAEAGFREKGRMAGQDTDVAVAARKLHFGGVGVNDAALRRDDFEMKNIGHVGWMRERGAATTQPPPPASPLSPVPLR